MIPQPQDYNLRHLQWRPYQYDSVSWCLDAKGYNGVEAPVGSGKTSLARATSSNRSVIALCRTKNLQAENYGNEYGAAVLFGRSNYPCIHRDAEHDVTCAECLHAGKMTNCEYYLDCHYIQARDMARGSPFTALNYAYYLTARWPRKEGADVLFCDEAHQLSDITLNFAGCAISHKQQVDWGFPRFPEIVPDSRTLIKMSNPVMDAIGWLRQCQGVLRSTYAQLKQAQDMKQMAKCENLGRKVSATIDALEMCPEDWYIKAGAQARKFRGKYQPGFVARPLTARHHFPIYFDNGTVIMMSATIGNPEAFMGELGVEAYDFRAVPNQWPPEMRKVHILDAPRMGYKATPEDFVRQADVIAKAIKGCPSSWSGIVHVTRKNEANLLANRLGKRGLDDRVWVTPGWDGTYTPTDKQVEAWNKRRSRMPNSICVTWALWEGYNGLDEKIVIAAKCPFPSLGNDYEKQRLNYSHSFYSQRTAYQLEQGLGRTRRGRACDYGDDNGFVAIADGNWTRVKKYLSQSLREAIVE